FWRLALVIGWRAHIRPRIIANRRRIILVHTFEGGGVLLVQCLGLFFLLNIFRSALGWPAPALCVKRSSQHCQQHDSDRQSPHSVSPDHVSCKKFSTSA